MCSGHHPRVMGCINLAGSMPLAGKYTRLPETTQPSLINLLTASVSASAVRPEAII